MFVMLCGNLSVTKDKGVGMGLLDLFKRKDSVPEKVESCEKTDSAANAVKEKSVIRFCKRRLSPA